MPTADLLDNQVFSGFLLVAAGCTLALQSGKMVWIAMAIVSLT